MTRPAPSGLAPRTRVGFAPGAAAVLVAWFVAGHRTDWTHVVAVAALPRAGETGAGLGEIGRAGVDQGVRGLRTGRSRPGAGALDVDSGQPSGDRLKLGEETGCPNPGQAVCYGGRTPEGAPSDPSDRVASDGTTPARRLGGLDHFRYPVPSSRPTWGFWGWHSGRLP